MINVVNFFLILVLLINVSCTVLRENKEVIIGGMALLATIVKKFVFVIFFLFLCSCSEFNEDIEIIRNVETVIEKSVEKAVKVEEMLESDEEVARKEAEETLFPANLEEKPINNN